MRLNKSVNSVQRNVTFLWVSHETHKYILWADVWFLNVKLGGEYGKDGALKD